MQYLGLEQPGDPWSKRSRGLAEGLLIHEDSLNRFGIPRRVATDDEMDGWYEVDDTTVDHAEAAFKRWEKDTKHPELGVQPRIIDTRITEAPPKRHTTDDEEEPASKLLERGLDD